MSWKVDPRIRGARNTEHANLVRRKYLTITHLTENIHPDMLGSLQYCFSLKQTERFTFGGMPGNCIIKLLLIFYLFIFYWMY